MWRLPVLVGWSCYHVHSSQAALPCGYIKSDCLRLFLGWLTSSFSSIPIRPLLQPILNSNATTGLLSQDPPLASLSSDTIVDIIFGIFATLASFVAVWQGQRAWQTWYKQILPGDGRKQAANPRSFCMLMLFSAAGVSEDVELEDYPTDSQTSLESRDVTASFSQPSPASA